MSWFRKVNDKAQDTVDDLVDKGDDLKSMGQPDKNPFTRIFGDMPKGSMAQQIIVGGLSGGLSGLLFGKVGILAALAVGGLILFIQIANHQEWITVNWGRVDHRLHRMRHNVRRSDRNLEKFANSAELFVRENAILATSFACGFVIGMAAEKAAN